MKMQKCYIHKLKIGNRYVKDKEFCKVIHHCYYTEQYKGAVLSILNLKHIVPNKVPITFHNGFNYDYHFIIKELAEEFK